MRGILEIGSKTALFIRQDNSGRSKILEKKEVKDLLAFMPFSIRNKFLICYLAEDYSSLDAEEVRNFLRAGEIPKIVERDSTSSITFQWLYRQDEGANPIDAYFPESEAGRQIYARLQAIKANYPMIIKAEIEKKGKGKRVLIDEVGSGPNHAMIEMLAENPDLVSRVHIRNIDPDNEALEIGRRRAEELGLLESFEYVQAKMNEVALREADMISMIGILCPMHIRICRKILKSLKPCLRENGIIVYSTAQERMKRDPMCDYIMRLFGWRMDYKTDEQVWSLAEECGYKPTFQFFDQPYRHHCMTMAVKI